MLRRSSIQLLRFHFSFFLFPVYLFALSQVTAVHWPDAVIIFFVLHGLVYPSSNGYNSYMDRDNTPIGGLARPLQPTEQLFRLTILMDVAAVTISLLISIYFAAGVLCYILASRAYSYRGIRLKKYPLWGYLTVVICQGALVFFLTYMGSSVSKSPEAPLLPVLAATCLIGGYYPLTQVYQHEEDWKDGVRTISWLLGIKGTFIYCSLIFLTATGLMLFTFYKQDQLFLSGLFLIFMFPVVLYFIYWMRRVWKDEKKADFRSSLLMNILAAVCTTSFFGTILILKMI